MLIHALGNQASATSFKLSLSYQAIDFGFDAAMLGLLAAALGLPPVLAALQAGLWTDRVGGLWVTVAGDAMVLLSAVIALSTNTPAALFVSAGMHGIGVLMSVVGQQALLGETVRPDASEKAFGMMFTGNALGQMMGPILATMVATNNPHHTTATSGLIISLLLAALAFLLTPLMYSERVVSKTDGPIRAMKVLQVVSGTRGAWAVICLNAIVLAAVDVIGVFLPVWGQERGLSPAVIGTLLAIQAAATIMVRMAIGRIILLLGRRTLITLCSLFIGLASAGLTFVNLTFAALAMVLLGCAFGLCAPITLGWIATSIPAHARGSAMGIRLTVNRLAQGALPAVVGAVSAGSTSVFILIAILTGATSLLVRGVPFQGATENDRNEK